jgi:hypothetical protein
MAHTVVVNGVLAGGDLVDDDQLVAPDLRQFRPELTAAMGDPSLESSDARFIRVCGTCG